MTLNRRTLLSALGAGLAAPLVLTNRSVAQDAPGRITVDYATYNPVSLLLRERGYLEEALAADGIDVRWVQTLGSNKALEFLNAEAIDFGSTAGAAALGVATPAFAEQQILTMDMDLSAPAEPAPATPASPAEPPREVMTMVTLEPGVARPKKLTPAMRIKELESRGGLDKKEQAELRRLKQDEMCEMLGKGC